VKYLHFLVSIAFNIHFCFMLLYDLFLKQGRVNQEGFCLLLQEIVFVLNVELRIGQSVYIFLFVWP
jgi:hypothetical protein